MILNKPKGFQFLSDLDVNHNSLEIILEPYNNDDKATEIKQIERKNPFSLSGSKAKQLVVDPYARYKEVVLGEKPYTDKELQTRMKRGSILEDTIIYYFFKPEYEDNPLWTDKLCVIDKRRRYVKNMPWISYELDLIVYKLDKLRTDYKEGFPSGRFSNEGIEEILPNSFIINNTSGAYDKFLATQTKHAIYDIKNSQLDALDNFSNYDCQLNTYGYFENVNRVGLIVLVKSAKLEELVKDKDASIVKLIFNSYDKFIKGLETGYTFEKEKYEGVCTELPISCDDPTKEKMLDNIYKGLTLFQEYNIKYKQAEKNLLAIKDYIKLNLPVVTNCNQFNITISLNSNETEKLSYYTTKITEKNEVNTKELIRFMSNTDIATVKTKEGKEIPFSFQQFFYKKISGGIGMFRSTAKDTTQLDPQIEKIFKGDSYAI